MYLVRVLASYIANLVSLVMISLLLSTPIIVATMAILSSVSVIARK